MVFAPDVTEALGAAVDLVNAEDFTSLDVALSFFDRWGYTGSAPISDADVDAVRALRPTLRTLFTSPRDDAVTVINTILRERKAVPQLVRHDHLDWHIHAVAADQPWHERILVESAMAMVDVVRADEMSRLQVCAATDCDGIVLDLSRNRSRRYCSTTCSNRQAQAAFRARQSDR